MKHPSRKANRLTGYDYSQEGMYFVTLCTHDRIEWFGDVQDNAVMLNRTGKTVADRWQWLAQQYPYVTLGPYVIMPNHICIDYYPAARRERS